MIIEDFDDFADADVSAVAWDCDPFASVSVDDYDSELDFNDSADSDWQTICLDRFGDRLVNGRY